MGGIISGIIGGGALLFRILRVTIFIIHIIQIIEFGFGYSTNRLVYIGKCCRKLGAKCGLFDPECGAKSPPHYMLINPL